MNSTAHITLQPTRSRDSVTFSLEGVPVAFANAIRRIMIADVPTLSVETVQVLDNTVCDGHLHSCFSDFLTCSEDRPERRVHCA